MRTLILVMLFGVGGYYLGYQAGAGRPVADVRWPSGSVDTTRARELGDEARDQATTAGARARAEFGEASMTARIKAKMALDDLVKASDIGVSTEGSVVTLTGSAATDAERTRAERIARETAGVTSVVNHVSVPAR